jgi:hypothetical protein
MSLEVERIMDALRALAKDTTRRESQRFVAAEQAIKTWFAPTRIPASGRPSSRNSTTKSLRRRSAAFGSGYVLTSRNNSTPSPPLGASLRSAFTIIRSGEHQNRQG